MCTNQRKAIVESEKCTLGRKLWSAVAPISVSILCLTQLLVVHASPEPKRIVVLTFDGSLKTHRTFVAPLLKEMGFGATFFVTHRTKEDAEGSLSWQEIAEIYQMGFEIGNQGWTLSDLSVPRNAARLSSELALVEFELRKVGVPRPVSFAYPLDSFGPEVVNPLVRRGYQFARRGSEPETSQKPEAKLTFDPKKQHPLLIPTTGSARPAWTLEDFKRVADQAEEGRIVVLRFHGVPDRVRPSLSTAPDAFYAYMTYLKEKHYKVIALRDLKSYLPEGHPPSDPLLSVRFPDSLGTPLALPAEMEATQAQLRYWLENMLGYHRYSWEEAAAVTGFSVEKLKEQSAELGVETRPPSEQFEQSIRILPYPGGRHPRIGHLEAAINPARGTKASIFLPWKDAGYVVIDLPETIESRSEDRIFFLAHTHVPTIWSENNLWLDNVDWSRSPEGGLSREQRLPSTMSLGASIHPSKDGVEMDLWVRNDSSETMRGLRAAICLMLKGAPDFNSQTRTNKVLRCPVSGVRSARGNRWILMGWEHCAVSGGNQNVPCLHADPIFPDCPPGETVRARGLISFFEGESVEGELQRKSNFFANSSDSRDGATVTSTFAGSRK